ncbi:MAG TPA: ankyrin repeat domain-containing protein [Candidatus Acidoferrum sp.]
MEGAAASVDNTKKLMEAIRAGDKAAVDALVGAEPGLLRVRAPNGSSVMLLAAYFGHPEVAEVFVRHGAKADVFEASALGDLETVRKLVSGDRALVNEFAADGFYPLGLAAYFGHRAIVEFLLKNGANVSTAARNAQKVTALHAGASRGGAEIVKILLEAGADSNAKQERGFVPLHSAAANGNAAIVELLLKHGARADAKADDGKTPADMAAEGGHKELAEVLKKANA